MIFDPMYFVFLAPAMLLAMWAQYKVKSAYARAARIPARSGISGAEAAAAVMRANGVNNVAIEPIEGMLSDHYDPRHKVLRLSPDVYQGRSLAALGIAAHEAGHALQDKSGYAPLVLRNGIVPLASIGSNLSIILIMIGLVFSAGSAFGQWMVWGGIGLFSTVVLFQLINLPVEFDASRRARQMLTSAGLVSADEDREVKRVLGAAAMTYVAATLTAVSTLLYYLMLAASQSRRE